MTSNDYRAALASLLILLAGCAPAPGEAGSDAPSFGPEELLSSATVNGAKAMGREDIGILAPGKLADLVILDANPLASVGNLSRIHRVMKDGKLYAPDALIRSIGPVT